MSQPDFKAIQRAFAAHIRDPACNKPPEGLNSKRLDLYRQLFFNNIESFIAAGFPVLRSILEEGAWHALVRDFYAKHSSQTPYFASIPREFLNFLNHERDRCAEDPPFMRELAHYEWLELDLAIAEATAPDEFNWDDVEALTLRLSDLVRFEAYRFPVHRLSKAYQPQQAPDAPTYLAVYRNRSDQVGFMELNQATFRLLQIFQEKKQCHASEALHQLALELGYPDPAPILIHGGQILQGLAQRGLIGHSS